MVRTGWKRQERQVAAVMGGTRTPNDGKRSPDVVTERFAIEVKSRKSLPTWLWAAVAQSQRNANGKLPLLVLSECRQGVKAKRLAVMDFDLFLDMLGKSNG